MMRSEQDGRGLGLYSSGEAARRAMAMAAALFASAPSRASMAAARSLARGRTPGRRVFRVSRGNEGFRVGAWAGDGSVSVMTRQRRRKALRVYAAGSGYADFVTAECAHQGVQLYARLDGCFSFDHAAMGRLFRQRMLPALEVAGRAHAGLWAMDCETQEGRES